MKKLFRLLALAAVLAGLRALPFRATDAARLTPVQTVIVRHDAGRYEIDVGKAVRGVGRTLSEALEALRRAATGELFFRTAEQVVLVDPGVPDQEAIRAIVSEEAFRPAAGLYRTADPRPDTAALSAYLQSHSSNTTIGKLRGELLTGQDPLLPVIRQADGGYLVETP